MELLGKKILILTAHPDDESFLTAGLIHKNRQAKGESYLLCATLGGRGKYHLGKAITRRALKAVRKLELTRVCKFLKMAKLKTLDLPDGDLNLHKPTFLAQSLLFAQSTQPEVIISFGPDGITGHCDHLATFEVAQSLAGKLRVPFVRMSLSPKVIPDAHKWLGVRRKNDCYVDQIVYTTPNIQIKIDPDVKLRALKTHKSQFLRGSNPLYHFPPKAAREILNYEYFIY